MEHCAHCQYGIAAAKGKRIADCCARSHVAQPFAQDVAYPFAGRIHRVQVCGGRNCLACQGQHRDGCLDRADRAQRVAVHGFGCADHQRGGVLCEYLAQCLHFNWIALGRGGSMRVHIINLVRR